MEQRAGGGDKNDIVSEETETTGATGEAGGMQ